MIKIKQIQQWLQGQFAPEMLRKNAIQLVGAGFFVIFLGSCVYGFLWYRDNSGLHAQELQVANDCKDKYRKQLSGHEISFEDVNPIRFGNDHIIVTGTASYVDVDGGYRNVKMSCDVDVSNTAAP